MKTIAEIRHTNLENLIAEMGTQDKVAELGGTSSVYLSQIKNQTPDAKTGKLRQMGDDMARKLEAGCGKPKGWMDNVHPIKIKGVMQFPRMESSSAVIASEANQPSESRFDAWTLAAIELLQKLDIGQRQAMVARMREYVQFLEPPQVGHAL